MTFRVTEDEKSATVFLTGDIDIERSPEARAALLATLKKGRSLIVDLAGVNYMDSSGVASLVEAYQRAHTAKQDFSLARVSEQVLKVLKLARLDTVFNILSTA
jgi:anti-sigma B factor antagonist